MAYRWYPKSCGKLIILALIYFFLTDKGGIKMARGDRVGDMTLIVSAGGTMDIRPSAGVTWIEQNIFYNKAVEIYRVDGANLLLVKVSSDKGSLENKVYHLSNDNYMQIKAVGANTLVDFDGFETSD